MVERTSASFEEFTGQVADIKIEPSKLDGDDTEQYHIYIKAVDKEIKGETGLIHEWVRISEKATETSVPEGSVLDRYLTQIEIFFPEAKKKDLINDVMQLLVGKKFLFKKIKLGKSYGDYDAKAYWTPVKLM